MSGTSLHPRVERSLERYGVERREELELEPELLGQAAWAGISHDRDKV